jgi:hypothetical protein
MWPNLLSFSYLLLICYAKLNGRPLARLAWRVVGEPGAGRVGWLVDVGCDPVVPLLVAHVGGELVAQHLCPGPARPGHTRTVLSSPPATSRLSNDQNLWMSSARRRRWGAPSRG